MKFNDLEGCKKWNIFAKQKGKWACKFCGHSCKQKPTRATPFNDNVIYCLNCHNPLTYHTKGEIKDPFNWVIVKREKNEPKTEREYYNFWSKYSFQYPNNSSPQSFPYIVFYCSERNGFVESQIAPCHSLEYAEKTYKELIRLREKGRKDCCVGAVELVKAERIKISYPK